MSKSGYYESSKGLEDVQVICAGFPRSGSTFIWQLLRDTCDGAVVKTHRFLPVSQPPQTVVVTIRDPRDCLVSQWRLRQPDLTATEMSADDIYQLAGECHQWHFHAQLYAQQRAVIVRYENWIADPMVLRPALCPGYDAAAFRRLLNKWGFAANKLRAAQLTNDWDRDTLLHPHHCHEGQPGAWRRFVPEGYARPLEQLLGPILGYWGYKPETGP